MKQLHAKLTQRLVESLDTTAAIYTSWRHAPFAVWVKDYTQELGVMVWLNDTYERVYLSPRNMVRADYIGRADLAVWDHETASRFLEHDRQALESVTPVWGVESAPDAVSSEWEHICVVKWAQPMDDGRRLVCGAAWPGEAACRHGKWK